MSAFDQAIAHVLDIEGGYVHDPDDSGGETNHGVTLATARAAGYKGEMKDLTKFQALDIAKKAFWDPMDLDVISAYDYPLALKLLEVGYHSGPGRAGEFLQKCLNAANNRQAFWRDVTVDGDIGAKTLAAVQAMFTRRGQEGMRVLRAGVNCYYGAFLTDLTQKREKDEKYWYGWMKQRVA